MEEHTKTDAGQRVIPFTKGARQIVSMIKSASEKYGYHDSDYIFAQNPGVSVPTQSITTYTDTATSLGFQGKAHIK